MGTFANIDAVWLASLAFVAARMLWPHVGGRSLLSIEVLPHCLLLPCFRVACAVVGMMRIGLASVFRASAGRGVQQTRVQHFQALQHAEGSENPICGALQMSEKLIACHVDVTGVDASTSTVAPRLHDLVNDDCCMLS
jgi:hypothetical protein